MFGIIVISDNFVPIFFGKGYDKVSILMKIISPILIFMGITAYDIQKIKKLYELGYDEKKLGIIGALDLYLDFINIFLQLIKYIGKER